MSLKNTIPQSLLESDPELRRLVEAIDDGIDTFKLRAKFDNLFDPLKMDNQILEKWLATFNWKRPLAVDQRLLLSILLIIYKLGGTEIGIRLVLQFLGSAQLTEMIRFEEVWPNTYKSAKLQQFTYFYDGTQTHAHEDMRRLNSGELPDEEKGKVLVYIPGDIWSQKSFIREVCNIMRPVHAVFIFRWVEALEERSQFEELIKANIACKLQSQHFGNRRWHNGDARVGSYGPATEGDAPPRLGVASRITDRPFGEEGYAPLTHGGERYRHTGSLLRQPLYFYDGSETHVGAGLRQMGWAWYGDCTLLHNGAIAYGGPRTHDGAIKHGVAGDGMTFTVRRKRQPVLAA